MSRSRVPDGCLKSLAEVVYVSFGYARSRLKLRYLERCLPRAGSGYTSTAQTRAADEHAADAEAPPVRARRFCFSRLSARLLCCHLRVSKPVSLQDSSRLDFFVMQRFLRKVQPQ